MKIIISLLLATLISGCATYQHSYSESNDKEQVTFAILGYINEYIGRYYGNNSPTGLIEWFGDSQTDEADRFENLLIRYHQIMNRPYSVRREIDRHGTISFYDTWMSEQVNQYYHHPYNDWFLTINRDLILSGSKESLNAYIESVWDRQYYPEKDNQLYFANAGNLSETVAEALIAIGSEWVVIFISCEDMTPRGFRIHFDVPTKSSLSLKETKDDTISNADYYEWKRYSTNSSTLR